MKLPILMYHAVDELTADVRHPKNYVSPERFAAQMRALLAWGFSPISLDDWLAYRARRRGLPRRPVIITFDDGYRNVYRNAWPVLRELGVPWTVFVIADRIGGVNDWEPPDERRLPLMDAAELRALAAAGAGGGVTIGSHGSTHRPLARIPESEAADELARSRRSLEALLGQPVEYFAYPFSNQSPRVRALARAAGYRACVRGRGKMNFRRTDPFGLRRIQVDHQTTVERLRWTLARLRWLSLP